MYKNIGGKIKKLTVIVTWIGIAFYVILGIAIMAINADLTFVGLLLMIAGSFFSWLGSILLYGYGQLIENSDKLVLMNTNSDERAEPDLAQREKEQKNASQLSKGETSKTGNCDICGKENIPVTYCTIKDNYGIRYRNMCAECMEKHSKA